MINVPVTFYCFLLITIAKISHQSDECHDFTATLIASKLIKFLYQVPIASVVIAWMSDLRRKQKLSKLNDSNGTPLLCSRRCILPFLPDRDCTPIEIYNKLREDLVMKQIEVRKSEKLGTATKTEADTILSPSWALVTGASRGIGRAVAISLARRNIPVVLVARDEKKLKTLSELIEECYGVNTLVIPCDLGSEHAVQNILNALTKAKIDIDILINNAGVGETREVVDMSKERIEQLCRINVLGTTKLTHAFASIMKKKRRGRIAIMSSITGIMPGVPTSAVYAATKSYQRSFAASLGAELEAFGVGVSCIMPGAVKETRFAHEANMADAVIFAVPFCCLTPDVVGESTVVATLSGRRELVVGWFNILAGRVINIVLHPRLVLMICKLTFNPMPYRSKKIKKN